MRNRPPDRAPCLGIADAMPDARAHSRRVVPSELSSSSFSHGAVGASIIGRGRQVVLPPGYLRGMYELTRSRGGITIADEVRYVVMAYMVMASPLTMRCVL